MVDIEIQTPAKAELKRFCALTGSYALTPEQLLQQAPDLLLSVSDSQRLVARASLWWRGTPAHQGERIGYIGHFAVTEGDGKAARALLHGCAEQLSSQGCTLAVGPIDGSTWRHYRLLTQRGDEPVFFLEPDNPDSWPRYFESQGFSPLTRYYSSVNDDIRQCEYPAEREAKFHAQGITLQPMDAQYLEQEMRSLYTLSCEAFADNFLYTPISEGEFLASYRCLTPVIDCRLIYIARHQERPVGFCFCLPDVMQQQRGQQVDTAIMKTLAVLPAYQGLGLGGLLIAKSTQAAQRLGMRRSIHAMMHEENRSRLLNRSQMRDFRQYTLYGKAL